MKIQPKHQAFAYRFQAFLTVFIALQTVAIAQIFPNLGGQRAGISAMTFLKNELSPRAVAMGGAAMALPGDGFAMGLNPAAATGIDYPNVSLSSRTLTAGLYQSYLGAMLPMANKSTLMVSMNYISSGYQKRRTEFQPFGDGTSYSSNAWKLGLGYSKSLSKMFSFGVNVNLLRENLAQYGVTAASVDLGFLYRTDWKDLSFAVTLRDFGVNSTISGSELAVGYNRPNGVQPESYGAPTLFAMGISIVPLKIDQHQILAAFQLNHPNDNAENLRLGAEYCFDSLLFVRAGFKINVPGEHLAFGAGVKSRIGAFPFRIEATAMPNTYLGWQYILGVSIGFIKPGQ